MHRLSWSNRTRGCFILGSRWRRWRTEEGERWNIETDGMVVDKKDVVDKKKRRKKCLRGHILALSPQTSLCLSHAHTDVTSLMHTLGCYLQYLTVHPLSVVCLLSVQWRDFWDNFTLCNALPTLLLSFYLAELNLQTFGHIWPCNLEMSYLSESIGTLSLIKLVFIE